MSEQSINLLRREQFVSSVMRCLPIPLPRSKTDLHHFCVQAFPFFNKRKHYNLYIMALYTITTKMRKHAPSGQLLIEPGMSVTVPCNAGNPVYFNKGQLVVDAFLRMYGVDLRAAGALNASFLDVKTSM